MSPTTIVACTNCGTRNRVPVTAAGAPRCGSCHRPLAWIVESTGTDFADVTTAPVPVLVDLWAPWCGPCLLRDGREVGRRVGALPEHALRAWVDDELARSSS
jgi:thioredoxin-like negative regulator of GroEL